MEILDRGTIEETMIPHLSKGKRGPKSRVPFYQLVMLIVYRLKTGCQWRMLPSSFAKRQLVYYHYKKWSDSDQFDLLLSKLRARVRLKRRQSRAPSLGIIDSQSVRWGNNRSLNGYDGNKKVVVYLNV